ncbi:hypothetical protein N7478_003548 [Penicillium angulare]|uniref:uncharacterized protein n=1 Tax=Penicillium angulare TaxID=116970 RepID=UPI0025407031|nr:uncharacterized protein N7478_003548 [Penicillium angulare]KAJ5287862.1 hypothetical protein N7478_003548 [Penicillium angulare]
MSKQLEEQPEELEEELEDPFFPEKSFNILQPLVWQLCAVKLGDNNVWVEPSEVEGCNHDFGIISIKDHKRDDYVLRVPCTGVVGSLGCPWMDLRNGSLRPDHTSSVAPLMLLRTVPKIPSPEGVAFDPTDNNPLRWPYVIEKKMDGQPLSEFYFDLPHDSKCVVAQQLGEIVATMHTVRSGWSGRLVLCPEGKRVMVKQIDDESQVVPYEILDGKPTKNPKSTLDRFAAILPNQLQA